MNRLASKDNCTSCRSCEQICPEKCISFVRGEFGDLVPYIDTEKCVGCGKCRRACHVINTVEYSFPMHAYAAWSKDEKIHENAASGGIASEIYKYCIDNEIFSMGTVFDRTIGVGFREVKEYDDIKWARDSKYVHSDMSNVFDNYVTRLKSDENCVFIGLPCQVAALNTYLHEKGIERKKLLTVDLICHGTPPWSYLDDHLSYLESKKHTRIKNISFRGPRSRFLIRCFSENGRLVYENNMHADDTFYRAFCENLIFKESCYQCKYARYERISDITIGDYSGLGEIWKYKGNKEMVSVILANSEKGKSFISSLTDKVEMIERNICEPPSAKGNPQLREPASAKKRQLFLDEYKRYSIEEAFEKAARITLRKEFIIWKIKAPVYFLTKSVKNVLPDRVKRFIKGMIIR